MTEDQRRKLEEYASKICAFYWSDVHAPSEHSDAVKVCMELVDVSFAMAVKAERDRCVKLLREFNWCDGRRCLEEQILNPASASKENE